ncbi:MAG: metal-dependent hydrolase [Bacteroidota bacterium]
MTITYFGHSAIQAETDGPTLLFDPHLSGNPHTEADPASLSPDVVLLTHAHFDHYGDTEAILQNTGSLLIAQFEIMVYVQQQIEHETFQPMNTGGTATFDWGRVTNTHARHSSSFADGTYGGLAGGFVVELDGLTIFNSGDTALFSEMADIGDRFDIDVAFLPVGDVLTMGPDDAVRAAQMLRPTLSIPVHWGTFPFFTGTPEAFVEKMRAAGMDARHLAPGDTLDV